MAPSDAARPARHDAQQHFYGLVRAICGPILLVATSVLLTIFFLRGSRPEFQGGFGEETVERPAVATESPFGAIQQKVEAGRRRILEYYEGDEDILRIGELEGPGDRILADRLALRILRARKSALEGTEGADAAFVIGHLGSSVTAGHDGFYHTAYPAVLQAHLGPLFGDAGLTLEVRNAAVGGRGPWLEGSICLENQLGIDADVIVREWEYWSLDDGARELDIAVSSSSAEAAAIELFLRQALRLHNQPAVHFLKLEADHHQGDISSHAASLATTIFRSSGQLHDYAKFAISALTSFGQPFDHLRERYPVATRSSRRDAGAECAARDADNIADCPVLADKQDGYHTRPEDLGFNETRFPRWEESNPSRFRNLFANWHPGLLGHEVIGKQLTFFYAGHLLAALDRLERDYAEHQRSKRDELSILTALEKALHIDVAPLNLPEPLACNPNWCEYDASCAYSTMPHFENVTVQSWVHPSDASTWQKDVDVLTYENKGDEAREEQRCRDAAANPDDVRENEECLRKRMRESYTDAKRAALGWAKDGRLLLGIDTARMMKCRVVIGEQNYGWSKPNEVANWQSEVAFYLNDDKLTVDKEYSIVTKGHQQYAVFDLRAIMGSRCRRDDIVIGVEVTPIDAAELEGICGSAGNGEGCTAAGPWHNHDICDRQSCKPKDREPEAVRAFVAIIMVF